jgi:mercuric reductase
VERSGRILKDYELEIGKALTDILRAEGIRVLTRAEVNEVVGGANGVRVSALVRDEPHQFQAAKLLVAGGRRPNTAALGLEHVGVQLDERSAVVVYAYLKTSVSHIWAAGDVIGHEAGSQMATPVGAHDGGIAVSNALTGAHRRMDHTVIPRAIFTDPQVAVVGLTDREANARGFVYQCDTIPMSVVPRAGAIRDTRGVIKMVLARPTRPVLGVSMLGVNAGEVIHEAAMALLPLTRGFGPWAGAMVLHPCLGRLRAPQAELEGGANHSVVDRFDCGPARIAALA